MQDNVMWISTRISRKFILPRALHSLKSHQKNPVCLSIFTLLTPLYVMMSLVHIKCVFTKFSLLTVCDKQKSLVKLQINNNFDCVALIFFLLTLMALNVRMLLLLYSTQCWANICLKNVHVLHLLNFQVTWINVCQLSHWWWKKYYYWMLNR